MNKLIICSLVILLACSKGPDLLVPEPPLAVKKPDTVKVTPPVDTVVKVSYYNVEVSFSIEAVAENDSVIVDNMGERFTFRAVKGLNKFNFTSTKDSSTVTLYSSSNDRLDSKSYDLD